MKVWSKRILIGVIFALPLAMIAFAVTRVEVYAQEGETPEVECSVCHKESQQLWENGAHSQAMSDPVFLEAWQAEGEPDNCLACHTTGFNPATGTWEQDGVTCAFCHPGGQEGHPFEPTIEVDRSAEACGSCHTVNHFEWEVSAHQSVEMACVACHDPHDTQLKAGNVSDLCATCHQKRALTYVHTSHNQIGLNCADCHLEQEATGTGGSHSSRDHSFEVKLSTCTPCHADQIHTGINEEVAVTEEPVDAMASAEDVVVTAEPNSIGPVGFASVAGLIGMASGMILAPWLEQFYRRIREED